MTFRQRRALAILPLLILTTVACQTSQPDPPNVTALRVLDATRASVAAAVTVFNGLVASGKINETDRQKAILLRQAYMSADNTAMLMLGSANAENLNVLVGSVARTAADFTRFVYAISGDKP